MFKKILFAFYMPILLMVLFMASTTFVMTSSYEEIKGNVTASVTSAAESIAKDKLNDYNLTFQDIKDFCSSPSNFPEEYKEYEVVCESINKGEIRDIKGIATFVAKNELEKNVFSKIEEDMRNAGPLFILIYLIATGSYAIYLFFIYSVKKESVVFYIGVAIVFLVLLSSLIGFIEQQINSAITSEVVKKAPPEIRVEVINAMVQIKEEVLSKMGDALLITSALLLIPLGVWALIRISLPTK